jgi:ankyrin repeat protein
MIHKVSLLLAVCIFFSLSPMDQSCRNLAIPKNEQKQQKVVPGHSLSTPDKMAKLLSEGANPNYTSPQGGITLLMKAVQENKPALVSLLLQWRAEVNVYDQTCTSVREYNLLYNKIAYHSLSKYLMHRIAKIKMFNTIAKHPIDCKTDIYFLCESKNLRNALLIDKMIEVAGAPFIKGYLLLDQLKQNKDTKKMLLYVLGNHQDIASRVPAAVYQLLGM